ncbi:MAG: alanyl-tRNA editing protein, partial [Oscillospiraceae bacterium]|nr:alanyl-tRNA editing protein [Oscillospiraceae bacterium]
ASIELTPQQLAAAETAANDAVRADAPIQVLYPTDEELASITYRSKKELEGQVRIVVIPGADTCACCGTHVERTGQVGIVKIVSFEKFKGGTRLYLACGARAWKLLAHEHDQVVAISGLLSAKPAAVAEAVERITAELAAQKQRCALAETHWFQALAAAAKPEEDQIMLVEGLNPDSLRRLCLALSEKTTGLCAVFSPGGSGLAYALAQAGQDVRPAGKALNEALNGRGGGKPVLVQGSIAETDFEKVQAFFAGL